MTQDEIIEMARQAGSLIELAQEKDLVWLASFAKLVAQHTLSNIDPSSFMSYQEGMEAGRLAEREACAKLCEKWTPTDADGVCDVADAIRERGQE
jgi:predicted acylesterase/phospholipase RssA